MAKLKPPISGTGLNAATWLKNYNKAMGDYYGVQRRLGQTPDETYFEKQLRGGMMIYRPIQPNSQQEAETILAALGISPETQPRSFKNYLAMSEGPMALPENPTMEDWFARRGWVDKYGKPRAKRHGWEDQKVRVEAVRFLVLNVLKKDPKEITKEDFGSNCLDGLLSSKYSGNRFTALEEAGLANFHPWEMAHTPNDFYATQENRIAAVQWLVSKLKKDPREITAEDFYSNGLTGLLVHHYSNSPYVALQDAGLADFHPWEMSKTPKHIWESSENRIEAITWFVQELGKDLRDITGDDFTNSCLSGLFQYYDDSPYAALKAMWRRLWTGLWQKE